VKENEQDGVLFTQHQSMQERIEVGEACMIKLALEPPAIAGEMDGLVAKAYAAMPERLYLIGKDGNIAYKGGMGPMFFRPLEWGQAIREYLAAH